MVRQVFQAAGDRHEAILVGAFRLVPVVEARLSVLLQLDEAYLRCANVARLFVE